MERLVHSFGGLPGFSNSTRTTGIRSKIWLMIGILGLTLTFTRISDVSNNYFIEPFLTKVDVKTALNWNAFPSVTICTLNKISCSKTLQIDSLFANVMKRETNSYQKRLLEDLPKICRLFKMAGCSTNCSDGSQFQDISFDDLYANLTREIKKFIGESMETTLVEFKYNNTIQNSSHFWLTYHLPMIGNCFHFNYQGLVMETGVGEREGMELLIRLNSDPDLKEGLQDGKHGLILTVQRPFAFPTFTLNRMDLEPGMNYIIPMTRGSWSFKKSCISFWNQTNIETFQNKAIMQMLINFQYDQHVCHGYCQLESIYKHCGCISTSYESIRTRQEGFVEANGTIARSCLSKDKECALDAIVGDPETTCGCKLSCLEETFHLLPSQGKWPGEASWKNIAEKCSIPRPIINATELVNFDGLDIEEYTDFLWRKKVDMSVLKLNIFLFSKDSLEFTENLKFESGWEIMAKMGGSMSVFMGLCFVAMIEVIGTYFIGLWTLLSCQLCQKPRK